jgi:hypothetical protein
MTVTLWNMTDTFCSLAILVLTPRWTPHRPGHRLQGALDPHMPRVTLSPQFHEMMSSVFICCVLAPVIYASTVE